jgi:hypothetical protein
MACCPRPLFRALVLFPLFSALPCLAQELAPLEAPPASSASPAPSPAPVAAPAPIAAPAPVAVPLPAESPRKTAFEVALAPGVGYFLYPQFVDQGFYINGRPYNLVWRGLQLDLAGDFHLFFPSHPNLGIGLAGTFLLAPNPKAADWDDTVSVEAGNKGIGGYFALSGCFWPTEKWRLVGQAGYGGSGVSSGGHGYGGWGFMFSAAVHRLLGTGRLVTGVGLRALTMVLSTPGHGSTRGEDGLYYSLLMEALFDLSMRR